MDLSSMLLLRKFEWRIVVYFQMNLSKNGQILFCTSKTMKYHVTYSWQLMPLGYKQGIRSNALTGNIEQSEK